MKQLLEILKGGYEWLVAKGVTAAAASAIVLLGMVVALTVIIVNNTKRFDQGMDKLDAIVGKMEMIQENADKSAIESDTLRLKVDRINSKLSEISKEQAEQGKKINVIVDRMPDPLAIYQEFNRMQSWQSSMQDWQDSTGRILYYLAMQDAKNKSYNITVTPLNNGANHQ